jgi:type II restriction enzyme
MKLGFEESQTPYSSGSQNARAWTERWVKDWIYCPNCGSPQISQFAANRPVADFFCPSCSEEYELKSQKSAFGARVVDGAFKTMCERLAASNNPNLLLLNYDLGRASASQTLSLFPSISSFGKSSKSESHSPTPLDALAGLAATSC